MLCQTPVKYFYYSGINNYKRNKNRASPVIAFLLISLVNVYTACMCRGRTNPHPGENRSVIHSIHTGKSVSMVDKSVFFCHLIISWHTDNSCTDTAARNPGIIVFYVLSSNKMQSELHLSRIYKQPQSD